MPPIFLFTRWRAEQPSLASKILDNKTTSLLRPLKRILVPLVCVGVLIFLQIVKAQVLKPHYQSQSTRAFQVFELTGLPVFAITRERFKSAEFVTSTFSV